MAQTSMTDVQRQKKEKQEEIKRTSSKIDSNKKEITRQLNSLRSIEADITAQQSLLNAELAKVQDDFYKMQAVVNLYYALGGGRE